MSVSGSPIALVLASGFSRRFGADKRTARLSNGNTLLETVIQRIRTAGIKVKPVLRAGDKVLRELLPSSIIIADDIAERGIGSTIAAAIEQFPADRDCMICLGDMPFVLASTYAAIAALANPAQIISPLYAERRGNPVLFGANFLPDLGSLSGDNGAKNLLHKYADAVIEIHVNDDGIHRDVDIPIDLNF